METDAQVGGRGGERGVGRGRGRARSRAVSTRRGRGQGCDVMSTHETTAETELERVRQNIQVTNRAVAKMSAPQRAEYQARKMAKQAERVLLPDAPPRKRARNNSPTRVPCRLVEGTPAVPPPPKPQSWPKQRPIVEEDAGTSVPPPPNPQSPQTQRPIESTVLQQSVNIPSTSLASSAPPTLVCDWTTGGLRQADTLGMMMIHNQESKSSSPSSIPESDFAGTMPMNISKGLIRGTAAPQSPVLAHTVLSQQQSPPPPTLPASRSNDEPDQLIFEWMEQLSDAEDNDQDNDENVTMTMDDCNDIDYTTEEPAHLPEDMDDNYADFVQRQDGDADRLLTELLTRDRTDHTIFDDTTFDWTNDKETFLGRREEFVGPSGPTFTLNSTDRPLDIFMKYFDDEVFNLIVTETNRNCDDLITKTSTEQSRFSRLKGTDKSEMAIFLAILVLQGLLPLPVERDYFKENGYLTLKHFKTLMTYNRFVLLKRLLHLTDDNDVSTVDNTKLRKLGPLLNLLRSKFKGLYLPSRDIAIDESLLKWHGHLSFAQKIATKAAKVGIKTYELCESSTGYCWDFFIYTGKGHTHDRDDDDIDRQETDRQGDEQMTATVPRNLTAQIVLDLARPLLNRGHTLVMDNFYNSPLLARYLKRNKTDCFGTLRVNREFVPEAIKHTSKAMLRPGELVQSYCRDLSLVLWRDSNIVAMISTMHAGEVGGKEKYGTYKYKPQVVLDYNLAMGGVDKKDQLLSAHPMERKRNQAWYKKVFRRLLNVTILNSYIVYKTLHPRTSQREFRTSLANEMIAAFRPPQVERPLEVSVREVAVVQKGKLRRPILSGNHFVGAGHSKYLTCVYCRKARTAYICKQCNVSLCLQICFENYHTVM